MYLHFTMVFEQIHLKPAIYIYIEMVLIFLTKKFDDVYPKCCYLY